MVRTRAPAGGLQRRRDFAERNSMGRPTFLWGVMIGLAVVGAILLVV
jgi:hypothetical protein